jgi:hypothetical protein
MKIKSILAKPFAVFVYRQIKKSMSIALSDQESVFRQLIKGASHTEFGKEHHFKDIQSIADFAQAVPVRDYETISPYIEKIKQGRQNVLWKGLPMYFAKTSGTTSGVKYIPITKDSIPNHIDSARNALLCYMAETGNTRFADGKMIFLQGSPQLERVGGIPTGRLSGIAHHFVPGYLKKNRLPSYETNCIEDWETKLEKIVDETINKDMTLIAGIPPWMQMYFDRLMERSGKKVGDLFPSFHLMVQGGVNFEPYKARLYESIGRKIDSIELFPASEGFFAFQDSQEQAGMLLNSNSGIFFEFIPLQELSKPDPSRLSLHEVRVGESYALIISSNAGLWAYNIGDVVKFVSTDPYRLIVTGRTKHFISAFGEHVIGEEVDAAMTEALRLDGLARVTEFTVAPMVSPEPGKSCHEWYVEFEQLPVDLAGFSQKLETALRSKNIYYDDLIRGNILRPLQIRLIQKDGFIQYMRSIGKLGGQNKLPRLSNDRKIAEAMAPFALKS